MSRVVLISITTLTNSNGDQCLFRTKYFNNFVEVLFDPATSIADARKMIVDNTTFLNSISFGGVEAANAARDKDLFDTVDEIPTEDDMASLDDENLMKLEEDAE